MQKITVDIQFFHGCPGSEQMLANLKSALIGLNEFVDFNEYVIDTDELAQNTGFRGSPTLLINGEDFENMPSLEQAHLSCRFYSEGLPSVESIRNRIIDKIGKVRK